MAHFLLPLTILFSVIPAISAKTVCVLDFLLNPVVGLRGTCGWFYAVFCYLCRGEADDVLILLVHDDLRDAEHVPHEFPHRLGADVGVPEPENLVISWKYDTGLFSQGYSWSKSKESLPLSDSLIVLLAPNHSLLPPGRPLGLTC